MTTHGAHTHVHSHVERITVMLELAGAGELATTGEVT